MSLVRITRIFAFILILNSFLSSAYEVPEVTIQALKPKGFRVSIPDAPDIGLFVFQGNLNRPISRNDVGTFTGEVTQPTDGRWVYEDTTTQLKEGDIINYYVFVSVKSAGYVKDNLTFTVRDLEDPTTPYTTHKPTDAPSGDCQPTLTVVRGGTACAGQTVFEDHFDTLREEVWQLEQYVPSEHPSQCHVLLSRCFTEKDEFLGGHNLDPEDVKFLPERGFIKALGLEGYIKPRGADHDRSVQVAMDVFSCTGTANECSATASGATILPPVVTGRVTSKGLAFTFGTVLVRAKLPQGDWLYPEILLEPFRKKYGSGFASGVLKIACARGNSELYLGVTDFGNKVLYGGPIMDQQCLRYLIQQKELKNGKAWGDDFHVYSVNWTPEQISLLVDGEEWARIQPVKRGLVDRFPAVCQYLPRDFLAIASKMAPFDDHFFITLGVAAGGITEFQDDQVTAGYKPKPWRNQARKASLNFWQDMASWKPTWTSPDLLVDYVKVIAL